MPFPARPWTALALVLAASLAHAAEPLHGAGATFPAPVIEAWAEAWSHASGTAVRYDPVGSGLGAQLASHGQVDFGVTDAPLTPERLASEGLRQFPIVIGAVVPVVNLGGVAPGRLVLDAATISAIYRGRIDHWRDPAIAALNPGLALPDARITVVHRADASGSTWLFTRWLSEADPAWHEEIGTGPTIPWPTGTEGLGNEGVASLVQRTRASIGYVALAYAHEHHLSDVALPSHDGPVLRAGRDGVVAALEAARWHTAADLSGGLTNQPGARSWPLVGASYALLPSGADTSRAEPFLRWSLAAGASLANALGYVALPGALAALALPASP